MHPEYANSPKDRLLRKQILRIDPEGLSVADVLWRHQSGKTGPGFAGRLNGDLSNNFDIGSPNLRGNGGWFLFPWALQAPARSLIIRLNESQGTSHPPARPGQRPL